VLRQKKPDSHSSVLNDSVDKFKTHLKTGKQCMVLESGEVVSFGEWGGSGSLASGLLVVLCFV
jgi:hypothetical protein